MPINRRKFLQSSVLIGFAITTKKGRASQLPLPATERRDLFPQGVASGDPSSNSMILCTRRPPVNGSTAKKLTVKISTTSAFKKILADGTAAISAQSGWSCRLLAKSLAPNKRFCAGAAGQANFS